MVLQGLVSNFLHLNQTTIERRTAAFVGEALGCQHIDRITIDRELRPADGRGGNNASQNGVGHLGAQDALTAIVEHTRTASPVRRFRAGEASAGCSLRGGCLAVDPRDGYRRSSSCCRRFWARSVRAGNARQDHGYPDAIRWAARNRACRRGTRTGRKEVPKPPLANGRSRVADFETYRVLAVELIERDALYKGMPGIEQSADRCRRRCRGNRGSSKPINAAKRRKISLFGRVSPGASKSWAGDAANDNGRMRDRCRCAPERWSRAGRCRQEIGHIGLELFEDNGEQVVSLETAPDDVLVRS